MKFVVEAGHIMQFARAVGEVAPRYHAALDGATHGVPAPPTFVQAATHYDSDYRLRPKPGVPWPPPSDGPANLHAEQHFEYHRPVLSGDLLTVTRKPGATWEKTGRSGLLVFTETITEYTDEAGELVVTARTVSVRRQA